MSLGELIKAYDEQQRQQQQQQQPVASTSTSPATIASTLSSPVSTTDSLELIPEEALSAPASAVHAPAESGILAQFLSVVPNVSLDVPAQGSASARLRASLGLPDLATLPPLRAYEHLATSLPKSAWKKQGTRCDMWECETRFKLFDGRRHCRKCGGIFCREHIARTTALIDMSRVPNHLPPRGRHIHEFHSELTPVANDALVCDGCHDLIHGVVAQPRTRSKPRAAVATTTTPAVLESKTAPAPSAPVAEPVKEKRRRRKSTKSSSGSSQLHASVSSGSHPSHSSSSLATTPPASTLPPPPPPGWVPPALCDSNGQPLSPALATLRMLQLGRAACYSPTFDPAVLDMPLGLSKNRKPDSPRQPAPPTAAQLLEQNYPLCVPSAVCKARASERRKEAWLAEMRRAGRAVDVDA